MNKNILAIDYGTKRIGLAINNLFLAEPLEILNNNNNLINNLKKIIKKNNINLILIGLSDRQMAKETKKFAAKLKKIINNINIKYYDESFSSKNIRNKIKILKKSKRSQPIDHFAAAEFLQDYLDSVPKHERTN